MFVVNNSLFISLYFSYIYVNTVLSPETSFAAKKKKSLALSTVTRIANRSRESFLTMPMKKRDEKRNETKRNPEVQRRRVKRTRDSVVEPVVEQGGAKKKKKKELATVVVSFRFRRRIKKRRATVRGRGAFKTGQWRTR